MVNYKDKIDRWVQRNSDEILQTLSELIQIKTENYPPGGNEKPGQEYLYNKILEFIPEENIDVFEIDDIEGIREHPLFFPTIDGKERYYKNRPNVVAKIKGGGSNRSIVFSGHIDVMPAKEKEWKVFKDPFSGKIKDGKMYGRGSMDMKAGTLAGFYVIKCIKDLGMKLKGDIYAESVIDEEFGGVNGTIAARLRNPNIDFAILPESSGLIVGIETVGGSDWKAIVNVGGPGGFGFVEELPNPIYKISKVALALEKYDNKLKKIKATKSYKKDQRIKLLTLQIYAGGSNYIESSAVPIEGHIYFWLEAFAKMSEEDYRKNYLDFMKKELGKYDDFKDEFPKFETVIRFLSGHITDTSNPAMTSIKKAYRSLDIDYKESGLGFACDAFAFKGASVVYQ